MDRFTIVGTSQEIFKDYLRLFNIILDHSWAPSHTRLALLPLRYGYLCIRSSPVSVIIKSSMHLLAYNRAPTSLGSAERASRIHDLGKVSLRKLPPRSHQAGLRSLLYVGARVLHLQCTCCCSIRHDTISTRSSQVSESGFTMRISLVEAEGSTGSHTAWPDGLSQLYDAGD
ncbi:hypothetical protein EVG20_g10644 [Dentipellis fragilis]|uniref:Uncharacterized protein n=1 Tax=Dentipellis fragilis TaxID=205917 RepID=A0A4Y9XPK4_9AGAM|nr:hypothetical protein EVG20_g10644 [Dentipellis fragilis]